nr:hypothetical protein [Tanacetum cinerariifolium]
MRTRSSSNLHVVSPSNPSTSNPKCRNRRRSKQPFILEESPIDTMADQRTMTELLRAPTEGYAEAIVVPSILAEQFELKHSLINMMTSDQFFGLEKDNPHDHIRWFNKITSTIKYKDVPNPAIKLMLFPFSLAGAARWWLEKEPSHSILTWEDLVSKFINEFFPPSRTTNLRNEISYLQQRFDESFHEAWDIYKDLLRACPHHGFTELHQLDTFYTALNSTDKDSLNSAAGGNLLERRTQDVLTIIENKSKVRNSQNKSVVSQVKSCYANSNSSSKIVKLTHTVNQQTSDVTTAMTAILKQFQATPPPASVKAVEEICVTCGGAHLYYQCLAAGGNTFPELQDNIQGYVSAAAVNYKQGNSVYRPPGSGSLPSNTVANPKGELKAITTRSGIVLDGPTIPTPTPFINLGEDERVDETLTDQDLAEYTIKEKLQELANTPLNENCPAVILKKLPVKLGDLGKFLIPCGFNEIKCKALADLGASINLMPLSVCKKLADFIIVDYESDPRVSLILGRPFVRTARTLIDVHGEEMILRDGDERLTLNMRHDTSSYSNQPQKESINLINVFNNSNEDFLEDLFSTNRPTSNPTFSSHPELTAPEVKDDIFDPEGGNVLLEKLLDPDSTKDLHTPLHFDIESDLKEIEYMLHHDPIKDIDSNLKDSINQSNLANLNNNLFDSMPEMFTDEHALDYSSPPIFDEYNDDLFEVKSDTKNVYEDPFDSKREKIKESKLLIDELDLPCDFLPSSEYDSFLSEDFSKVDALPSTNNEDKVFNPGFLIQENLFKIIIRVAPEKTTNLRNEILNFQQRFDELFHEAWDRYKDLLRACPHHGFTELHQLDTFYNALNPADQDSLSSDAGGNLLERRTQDVLTIIENKSKVCNSRNKSVVSQVKSSDANSNSSFEITKLTHAINQQTSAVTTAMTAILKQFHATPPPASVKAVEEIYVTYGGAHPYYQCLATGGNTFPELRDNIQGYVAASVVNYNRGNFVYRPPEQSYQAPTQQNQVVPLSELEKVKRMNEANMKAMQTQINNVKNELRNEMKNSIQASMSNQTNELKNMMASFFQMNTASTSRSGSLPSNTVSNPKGELKAITTRSGIVLDGPSVPIRPPFINPKEDERVEETLTDQDLAEYTIKVPPHLVKKSKPPSQRNFVVHQRDSLHANIPYPSRMLKQNNKKNIKSKSTNFSKSLLSNKEKLLELANTPLNENCSAIILKKLHEKLGDPGKFLIPCGFNELKCNALADLANRAICTLAGTARDVFVPVGKFTFPADFVIVDYESDPRVPLILGRPFLRTTRALIGVHGEEMILRDGDERLTLNMRHDTSSYSNQPQKESINLINVFNDSKGGNVLPEKLLDLDSTKDLHPPHHVNPFSGSTTSSSSPNQLLEEFADELALITFPSKNDDLLFDIISPVH